MIQKLPLNSPRWRDLDGVTAEEVQVLLEHMTSTADTGADVDWRQTWTHMTDDLLADGTVYNSAYAVLPISSRRQRSCHRSSPWTSGWTWASS